MSAKEILILKGDRPNTPETGSYFTWQNLQRVGSDTYYLEQYSDIIISIIDGEVRCASAETGRDIASYDLVYIRDITHENVRNAIAMYLQHHGKAFINSELGTTQYTDKLLQYVALAFAGVPVPQTVHVAHRHQKKAVQLLGGFPLVAKSTTGSNGNDNFLLKTQEDLVTVPAEGSFVYQGFIPNDFDYRVIVGDDQVLLSYKRVRQSGEDYRNNIAKGAERQQVADLSPTVSDLAVRAARTLGRNLSGVDVLENSNDGSHVILEVNFNYGSPRFEGHVMDDYFKALATFLQSKAQ